MKNNILLIDYGNSYIKGAIYDGYHEKNIEYAICPKTTKARDLLSKFNYLGDKRPTLIIETVTAEAKYVVPFNDELRNLLKADIKLLSVKDFEGIVKVGKPQTAKEIGADLLCSAYYLRQFKDMSAVFCFGSVYFCYVSKFDEPIDCFFIPSITKGLARISAETAIPQDYIPTEKFEDVVGDQTYACFSTGADSCIIGWIDYIATKHKIKPENIVLTGGDAQKFTSACKKYKFVDNLILKAMEMLVKEKKW